jgi:hypothetical protein
VTRRRALRFARRRDDGSWQEDPLSGVANLFDISLAFIVAMVAALYSMMGAPSMLDPQSSWTMTRTTADGRMEIVRKDGKTIKVERVSDKKLSGDGDRLGVAYRLPDGKVVYVPEEKAGAGK